MKKRTSFGLPVLLLAATLALTSCGSGESAQGSAGSGGDTQETVETTGGMAGMDHGSTEMSSGETAPPALIVDGEYSDERFIDMMAAHHQMAIDMAMVARENAELPEINRLADDIISAQQGEIDELGSIKETELGSSELPTTMSPEEPSMQAMIMPD